MIRFPMIAIIALIIGVPAQASVVWYINDYDGWAASAGDVYTIDFNTLPNGLPSLAGTELTPEFNYTSQGVTFSGPVDFPFIVGHPIHGFGLEVDSSPTLDRNWIIGELVGTTHALATSYLSFGILSIFDEQGQLIDNRVNGAFGTAHLGVISDVPIASFTLDRGSSFSSIENYYQGAVPEPAVLTLVVTGALCLLRARRGHRLGSSPTESPGDESCF